MTQRRQFGQTLTKIFVKWAGEAQPDWAPSVTTATATYAQDKQGIWWTLSEVSPTGIRYPLEKTKDNVPE